MWNFLRTLAQAIYRNTVGGLVRLVRNTKQGAVDEVDKRFVGRLTMYIAFAVLAFFFPTVAAVIATLRFMIIADVFVIIANIFQDTVNTFVKTAWA